VGVVLFRLDQLGLRASQIWLASAAGLGAAALLVLVIGRAANWLSWRWMLLLTLPALVPFAAAAWAVNYLDHHPSTAEISTDLVDPPAFTGAAAAPFPASQALIGKERHADIRALVVPQHTDAAFAAARAVAERRFGWRVTEAHPPETLQGTAVFGKFRYRRDWAVRVRPELGGGSLIDMRMRSRPGEPDMGDNAKTVEAYMNDVKAEAAKAAP
jgi:hypothetical protein